jgi:DNA-binding YbaB/EbfC family protein
MSDEQPTGLDGFDLGGLLSAAQGMQAQMAAAAADIAATEVEGSAGGGLVRITASGAWEFRAVRIDPAAADPEDPSLLEDLVLAALRDAAARVVAVNERANPLTGPGGLGDLGGLFGGNG